MKDLIERLEKATGPDRELDAQIFYKLWKSAYPDETPEQRLDYARKHAPKYTELIDEAIYLVPEGWAWFIQWIGAPFSEGHARLWIPAQRTQKLTVENHDVQAATPAIALCIAALRARVSDQSGV